MRSGLALMALNYEDWDDRYNVNDFSRPSKIPDSEIWRDTIHIAELAEPLGFDSIWVPEHHTSPYCESPSPLLIMCYLAGRTKKVDFGTMVLIPPWHHPFQVAGEMSLMENLLGGRDLYIGMGRGLSAREFGAFGIDQGESRERFIESIEVIRLALEEEEFSFEGQFYKIPPTHLRPRPRSPKLLANLMGAFGSPSSLPVVANLDLGMIFVAGQAIEQIGDNVNEFNTIREERGLPPNHPRVVVWMYCAETEEEVEEGVDFAMNFQFEANSHYHFDDVGRFDGVKGYEDYTNPARQEASRLAGRTGTLAGEELRQARLTKRQNCIIGTPEECIEKVRNVQKVTQAQEFIYLPQYGGMSTEKAEKSVRLFADRVLPFAESLKVSVS